MPRSGTVRPHFAEDKAIRHKFDILYADIARYYIDIEIVEINPVKSAGRSIDCFFNFLADTCLPPVIQEYRRKNRQKTEDKNNTQHPFPYSYTPAVFCHRSLILN